MNHYPSYLLYHEAAHAVAAWCLGEAIYGIHLRSRAEVRRGLRIVDRRGRECENMGLCEASRRLDAQLVDVGAMESKRDDVVYEIAACLSGPLAEARQSRTSAALILLDGGASDWRAAKSYASLASKMEGELLQEGERLAIRIVRKYWSAIEAVAQRIQGHAYTSGEVVHAMLDAGAGTDWPLRMVVRSTAK